LYFVATIAFSAQRGSFGRVVRKAIFDTDERKRLSKEAREYMALRSKRKKFVASERKALAAAHSGD
jgi:hypothetical protein